VLSVAPHNMATAILCNEFWLVSGSSGAPTQIWKRHESQSVQFVLSTEGTRVLTFNCASRLCEHPADGL
jgi:hypothetical protein